MRGQQQRGMAGSQLPTHAAYSIYPSQGMGSRELQLLALLAVVPAWVSQALGRGWLPAASLAVL